MKANLTAKEGSAIEWYRKQHNYGLVLSKLPIVTFRNRDTDKTVDIELYQIVYAYEQQKEEDQKTAAQEKRRVDNENKYKRKF